MVTVKKRNHIIIAIDGPAGAGKSTVAKRLASRFSLLYIDSGAMYRAAARKALEERTDISNGHAVAELARKIRIELKPGDEKTRVFVDGKEITDDIRTPEVTDASSRIATMPEVRQVLVEQQKALGHNENVVMEGRDIGTVVFPDTPLKFYLDASSRERARRRKKDLERAGYAVNLDHLEREVIERDRRDMTRDIGPLRKASDAILIDSTNMTIDEVVKTIAGHVEQLCGGTFER